MRKEEFKTVAIENVAESASNPRRSFTAMEELTQSIKSHGILVPLLVRPTNPANGNYEIVAGARRYRAALAADLKKLPVLIRDLSEEQALEFQVIENLQREDVHPMEEALGFHTLMERAGYDVAAVSAKIARSESYVYQRLKLLDLIEPAQEAFLKEKITPGHAVQIARLQPEEQKQALEHCLSRWGSPVDVTWISVRELGGWIAQNIHLDLHSAPFSKKAEDLLPQAGSCVNCVKRTGFVPALFPDIQHKDTCTDPGCFSAKFEAHIDATRKAWIEKGTPLLEITTIYMGYGKKSKPGEPLNDSEYVLVTRKNRCPNTRKALVVSGHKDRGKILEICADHNCKDHFSKGSARYSDPKEEERRKREAAVQKRESQFRTRIFRQVIENVPPGRAFLAGELEIVLQSFVRNMDGAQARAAVERNGWEPEQTQWGGKDYRAGLISRLMSDPNPEMLRRMLIELAVQQDVGYQIWQPMKAEQLLLKAAQMYSVDTDAIGKQLDKEAADRAAKKKAKKSKTAPAKQTKRKGKGKK